MMRRPGSPVGPLAGPLVALLAAGAVAAGCSTTTASTTSPTTTTGASSGASAASSTAVSSTTKVPATPAPGESQGAFVYRTQCASCHGRQGEGDLGPTLAGIAGRMSEADELARVRTGGGRMPPFSPALSDDELAAVVAYTRSLP